LKLDECVEINVIGYDNEYFQPNVTMRCESQSLQQISATLSLNGETTTISGSFAANAVVQLGQIKMGDNKFGLLCLTDISGATEVKCTGPSLQLNFFH